MSTIPTEPAPLPVAEIERRLRWRVLPTVLFIVILSALALAAYLSLTARQQHPQGLPDDPRAQHAFGLLAGRTSTATNGLRWRSTLLGGEPPDDAASAGMLARAARARPVLDALVRDHPFDPRPLAARAALDVVTHDYRHAATHYRHACELAPHYGEGRLGAGVALALEADRTSAPWQSRALRLEAIAEWTVVDSVDAEYLPALYDRTVLLREIGRTAEMHASRDRYLARDSTSAWAAALRGLADTR